MRFLVQKRIAGTYPLILAFIVALVTIPAAIIAVHLILAYCLEVAITTIIQTLAGGFIQFFL